jgi:HIT domain-containing protein
VPAWEDEGRWRALCDGSACPICARIGPPPDTLAELRVSWVTSGVGPLPVRGYACVIAKRHVVEPFELEGDERAAFWEDVLVAGEAIARHVCPAKMNYEIHGNTIPHLHVHLLPRGPGDRYGEPELARSAEELEALRAAFAH